MSEGEAGGYLRIGELSRRAGVSPEVLRAWERRYGLLSPARTEGGYRLYDEADVERVRRMRRHLARGISAAEAAKLAREDAPAERAASAGGGGPVLAEGLRTELLSALERFDEGQAQPLLDRLFARMPLNRALQEVVLPLLAEVGERWERRQLSVAQEHYTSTLLRGRLMARASGWGSGSGPRALLGCLAGEQHDIGLICFGLALRDHGWRIVYLGQDTPAASIMTTIEELDPAVVVMSTVDLDRARGTVQSLQGIAARRALALGGAGVDLDLAAQVDCWHLRQDPVSAADSVAEVAARGELPRPA